MQGINQSMNKSIHNKLYAFKNNGTGTETAIVADFYCRCIGKS